MNEEELKEIWKKDENFTVGNFDFERIKELASKTQKKLQRKIKWEISINILIYVLFIPLFFYFPKVIVVLPFMIAVWIWYLWENSQIYKYDKNLQSFENVKTFLAEKENLLAGYFKRNRYIGYLGTPFVFLICYIGMTSFEHFQRTPFNFLFCLLLVETLIVIVFEIYVRKIYQPILDELRNLLRQLDDRN